MRRCTLGSSRLRGSARRSLRARLRLETLEDRTLPAVVMPAPIDFSSFSVDPQGYDASRLLIRFASDAAREQFHLAGVTLGEQLPLVADLYVANLDLGVSLTDTLAALQSNPLVLYAQPDYDLHLDVIPNDSSFATQEWDLNNTGQNGGVIDADIDAPEAWDVTTGTGTIVVAVIDTGVDYNHPDLAANIWTNTAELNGTAGADDDHNGFVDDIHGYDFVNGDGDPMDDNSHGTHCAGTIGAVSNNATGVAGIIWHVRIMAVKFLNAAGSGSTSDAIKSLNYAVQMGAKISNNSWGGGGYDSALFNAIANAQSAGHIFVAAAGNNGSNNDVTPFYPASYNLDNVVAVAATDRNDALASFSNYGATSVDLGAPGVSIYSTTPGNTYGLKSGTSMATPHVTGALALLWDSHPTWTYSQVINQLLSTVDPLPSLAGKTVSGGRLNLAKAIGSAPQPSLAIGDASVIEGNAGTVTATFTVTLSASSTQTVTVAYTTANGTATAGSDYTAGSGTLTFAPGETSKFVTVTVNGDTSVEPNETFSVNLSNPTNATTGDSQGVGTIRNDDGALSITDVSVTEGNSGTVNATFTVSLTTASVLPVTVTYATADGAAVAGSDYVTTTGTLTFAPGETSKTITVAVIGDTAGEPDESFLVNLSNPTNATLLDGQGVGTIRNDDLSITINDVSVLEGNRGTTNTVFTVTLSAPSTLTVTVNFATANGSARNGSDYQSLSGSVAFNPGETSKVVTIKVKGDTSVEPDETFVVNLTNPANATLQDSQGVGTILNDDGAGGAAAFGDALTGPRGQDPLTAWGWSEAGVERDLASLSVLHDAPPSHPTRNGTDQVLVESVGPTQNQALHALFSETGENGPGLRTHPSGDLLDLSSFLSADVSLPTWETP
jgi:subtilisin family serine protease